MTYPTPTPEPSRANRPLNSRSFPAAWLPLMSKIADALAPLVDIDRELEANDMFLFDVKVTVRHHDDYQVGTFHLEDDWFMYNPGDDE